MKIVLDQVLQCPFEGGLKRIYLESKALELIALCFLQVAQLKTVNGKRVLLSGSDKENIHLAELILLENMQPPLD
ncbi:MAG: hypothetical protein Kow009_08140 [Spirochaetales bacterium]